MEATKQVKHKPKIHDKVLFQDRVCRITFVNDDNSVNLANYGGAQMLVKYVPNSALIFADENGSFPPPDGYEEDTSDDATAAKSLETLIAEGIISVGLPEEPTPFRDIAHDDGAEDYDAEEAFETGETEVEDAEPYFDKWAFLESFETDRVIDPETGEISNESALASVSDAAYLQGYQSDEALIALTEHVLELGKSDLETIQTIGEIQDARAKVQAIDRYIGQTMRDRQSKIEARNNLAELVLRQQRQIGWLLKAMPKNKGERGRFTGGTQTEPPAISPTLDDLNITKKQSSRWQKEAAIPDEDFEDIVSTVKENLWELSSYDLVKPPNKGYDGDEWYTPSEYIEAARTLMGAIDCDPASCELAQRVVKAGTFYTVQDNGLAQDWTGRVWLNPPYSQPKIEQFTERLVESYDAEVTTEAILLVNNCTDAGWFIGLARRFPVMFSLGRAKFWQADQKTFATRQGQAIFYLGNRPDLFFQCFSDLAYAPNVTEGLR